MAIAACMATAFEQRRPLLVDALVPDALFTSTHAITIDAPAEQVWPWIAQMGAGRAGWYSWDAIDNGGTPSATRVLAEFQTVIPGDVMPAVPGATHAFVVSAVEPPKDLVLTVPDGHGGHAVAWEHALIPLEGGRTRLLVRGRASTRWLDLARAQPPSDHRRIFIERAYAVLAKLPRPLLIGVAAVGHRVMEARHLRGIQRRNTAPFKGSASASSLRDPVTAVRVSSHSRTTRKGLLVASIASVVLYGLGDLASGLLYDGYSYKDQWISELTAFGSPVRALMVTAILVHGVLLLAFGVGIWRAADCKSLRWVGVLLMLAGVIGFPTHTAFAMSSRWMTAGFNDTMHALLSLTFSLIVFTAVVLSAVEFPGWFRLYSLATLPVLVAFGAASSLAIQGIAQNSTPWAGAFERINAYAYFAWLIVLALSMTRRSRDRGQHHSDKKAEDQRSNWVRPIVQERSSSVHA